MIKSLKPTRERTFTSYLPSIEVIFVRYHDSMSQCPGEECR